MSPPKNKRRRLYPLLIVFVSALILLSFLRHFSSTSISPTSSFNLTPLRNTTTPPNFTLTIKLLAFDRLTSISRCLRSLANADYLNDKVNLHVFIDHFKEEIDLKDRSILDEKLKESHKILDFVDGFSWKFGEKFVHYRTGNVGLQAQWLESWWPSSDDEFAFVVEDDLEVSPLFYKFLKGLILNYYYNSSNFNPSIYGASLQRPRFVPGKHGNKLKLDAGTQLFLYQLVGTWGQLLFPKPWKEFRLWYDTHKAKGIKPILQGMVTTGWYKKMGERIWTPWFIKFIQTRGYFNIYTNFLGERALSVSHRDAGVNYGKTAGPDSYLLNQSSLDFNLLDMQPLSELKWYDFCFREVLPGRVVRNTDELGSVLYSVQKHRTVILVSLFRTSEAVTKNMLCHFERLGIWNYILVGPESDFLLDLARRGHPVVSAEQLLNSIRGFWLSDFQRSDAELIKEILVKAYIIQMSLKSMYNSWVIDGNMLPTSTDMFADHNNPTYDFFAAKDSELLFVRSSSTASKIWVEDFIYKVAAKANSLTVNNSANGNSANILLLGIHDISMQQKASGSATKFLSLRDRFLELLFQENVADLILALTQYVGGSCGYLREDNLLLLEIYHYIFLGQEPELIAKASKNGSEVKKDVKASLNSLSSTMEEEKDKRRLTRIRNLDRHSQFRGSFTRLAMDGSKTLFKGNPGTASRDSLLKPHIVQRGRVKRIAWDNGRLSSSNETILKLLHDFMKQFISAGYNVLMQSIREDIEKEHDAFQNNDVVVFFQLSQFVTAFQHHTFLISKSKMGTDSSEAFVNKVADGTFFQGDICGPIAATMNEAMFLLVISKWRYSFEGLKETNDYKFLSVAGSLMKNMIRMLDLVLKLLPEDSKETQTARILLYKIFYDQTDQGMTQFLVNLIKAFDTHKQPKSDLADLIEMIHIVVRLMES